MAQLSFTSEADFLNFSFKSSFLDEAKTIYLSCLPKQFSSKKKKNNYQNTPCLLPYINKGLAEPRRPAYGGERERLPASGARAGASASCARGGRA